MSQCDVHFDTNNVTFLSLSENHICFVPTNDRACVFIAGVDSLRCVKYCSEISSLNAQLVCSEPYEITNVVHQQLANITYIVTYSGSYIRIRRSILDSYGRCQFGYAINIACTFFSCISEICETDISSFDFDCKTMLLVIGIKSCIVFVGFIFYSSPDSVQNESQYA